MVTKICVGHKESELGHGKGRQKHSEWIGKKKKRGL